MASPGIDVPLARDASERFLPWLVAFMVYLAALALVSGVVLHKLVQRWDSGLAGHLTVEVPVPGLTPAEAEQNARIDQVLRALRQTPGVTSAAQLAPGEIAKLLEPWLGTGAYDEDLPLPALIAVTIDDSRPPDLAALSVRLEQAAPGTLVDDHQRWLGKLLDLARSIQIVALVVVMLVALSAILTVVFVTRTGLSVHRQVIELLHLIGAHDAYIARQFQKHALRLGLRGGLIGLVLALATILPVGALLGRTDSALLSQVSLSLKDLSYLAALPVVAAVVAMITARRTVLGTLARMP